MCYVQHSMLLSSNRNIDRHSHMGLYELSDQGIPLNPRGRTGVAGRGVLWRWGPNHAADPIVSRWARDENGETRQKDGDVLNVLYLLI